MTSKSPRRHGLPHLLSTNKHAPTRPKNRRSLDDYTFQCILDAGPFSFSGLSLDNMTTNPQRGYPRVSNVTQGFERPTLRTRGLSIDALTGRGFDGRPLRLRFMEPNPRNGFGARHYFSTVHPKRLSGRSRFIHVVDEAQPARTGVREPSIHNEGVLPPYDCPGWDYYPWREQRPDRPRVTLSPGSGSRYRYEPQPQERQFRTIDTRPSTPRANGYRYPNANLGAQKDGSLPFGKVMRWLYEGLAEVETFFKNFQDSYSNEVKAIDKYAGAEILQNLWVRKITGKGAPQDDSQDKMPSEKWEEKFAEKRTSLCEAMEAALNASLSLGDQETAKVTTLESRKRL
jgi:hypothetical protein